MTLISFSIKNFNKGGGDQLLKKQSVSRIIKLREAFDLCDIWRFRNPKKSFTLDKSIFLELSNVDWTTYLF